MEWRSGYYGNITLYDIHISFLPVPARFELSILNNQTALFHGIWDVASEFGYTIDEIKEIKNRAISSDHQSAIFALLEVLDLQKDISVGLLYDVILKLKHRASDVIIKYQSEILKNFVQKKKPRDGQQNQESSICECSECLQAHTQRSRSTTSSREQQFHNLPLFDNFTTRTVPGDPYVNGDGNFPGQLSAIDSPYNGSGSPCATGASFSLPNNLAQDNSISGNRYSNLRHTNGSLNLRYSTSSRTSSIDPYSSRFNQEQISTREMHSDRRQTQSSPETSRRGHNEKTGKHRRQSNKSRKRSSNVSNSTDRHFSSSESDAYTVDYECNDRLNALPMSRSTNQEVDSEYDESFNQEHKLQKSPVPDRRYSPVGASDVDGASQTNVKEIYRRARSIFVEPIASPQPSGTKTVNIENGRNSWHGEESPMAERIQNARSDGIVHYGDIENPRLELNSDSNNIDDSDESIIVHRYNNDLDVSDSEDAQRSPGTDRNIRAEHSNSSNGAVSSRDKSKDNSKAKPKLREKHKARKENKERVVPQVLMKSKIRVFVSYSFDPLRGDKQVIFDDMIGLVDSLPEHLVKVTADRDPNSFRAISRNGLDWLEEQMRRANYIIICITPTYAEDIEPPQENKVQARPIQLNARYIFDKIRSEHYRNWCQNKRIIPVIFERTGATEAHVPGCFRSTHCFNFPNEKRKITKVILNEPLSLIDMI